MKGKDDEQESAHGGADHCGAEAGKAGRKAEDVAREQAVSKHMIYAWKAKYGGMEVRWRLHDECLNVSWFWNLFDSRRKVSEWQRKYPER